MKRFHFSRRWGRQGPFALAVVVLGPGVFLGRRDEPPIPAPAVVVTPPAPVRAVVVVPPAPVVVAGRTVDAASLDVQAGTPRFLPGTDDGSPLTRMPWVSPSVFIKMAQDYGFGPNTTVLSQTNMVTGVQTPLRAINAVIRKNWGIDDKGVFVKIPDGGTPGLSFNMNSPRLSPDGRWLLWEGRADGRSVWTAMTLDGARRMDWPRQVRDDGGNGTVGWMRDGVHFVEIGEQVVSGHLEQRACVCGLDAPGRVRVFPLTLSDTAFPLLLSTQADVCFTTDGHGWVVDVFSRRCELVPGPQVWTLRAAPLFDALDPNISERKPSDAALSPDGNRLVWHDYPEQHGGRSHFYVSRPDGSEARAIYETRDNPGYGVGYSPKWTPDGKGIVFSGRGGLYLLPLYPSAAPDSGDAPLRVSRGPFPTRPGEVFRP